MVEVDGRWSWCVVKVLENHVLQKTRRSEGENIAKGLNGMQESP